MIDKKEIPKMIISDTVEGLSVTYEEYSQGWIGYFNNIKGMCVGSDSKEHVEKELKVSLDVLIKYLSGYTR